MESYAVNAKDGRDGYLLNGEKFWIGNATLADYIIVWAKSKDDMDKIQAFVIEKGQPGLIIKKIEGKYSMRMT